MVRIPPLEQRKARWRRVVGLASLLALVASLLAVAPSVAAPVPSGDVAPSVWEPANTKWVNGNPSGYSQGQVAAFEADINTGASDPGDTIDVEVCLDYFTGDEYFFTDFAAWDTTVQPDEFANGDIVADMNVATLDYFSIYYPNDGSTLEIVSVDGIWVAESNSANEAICSTVSYTYDGTATVHVTTGGYISKPGDVAVYTDRHPDDTDPAVVLPTGGVVENMLSESNGTFKVRIGGSGDKTINFKGTDFDPPGATLTLIKSVDNTGGGTDTADEWTLSATPDGELTAAIEGATGVSDTVDPGVFDLAEEAADTVSGNYVADWDCGATTVSATDQITLASGDDVTCTVTNTYAALEIAKAVVTDPAPAEGYDVGDVIDYEITVTNPTNATLTNVSVSDPLLGDLDCDPVTVGNQTTGFTLPPDDPDTVDVDENVLVCTGSYTVQQSDIDSNGDDTDDGVANGDGDIDNTASADSDQTDEETASAEADLARNASIEIVKSSYQNSVDGDDGRVQAGDGAGFEITVTNDGNVSLTGVAVTDALAADCRLTAAEVEALDNNDDPAVVVGSTLEPGESFTYTCEATSDEVVDNDDDDATTTFTNTAGTSGSPVGGGDDVEDEDDATVTIVTPGLSLSKSASVTDFEGEDKDPVDTVTVAGDLVHYTVTASNTGEVNLTGVTVTDPKVTLSCDWPGVVGELAAVDDPATVDVDETQVVCTGTYTVQQSDLDSDGADSDNNDDGVIDADDADSDIDNTASADSDQTDEETASAEADLVQNPSVTILKAHTVYEDLSQNADSQTILSGGTATWVIVVINDGNVTLPDFTVDDPNAPDCDYTWAEPGGLAPGEKVDYTCSLAGVTEDMTNTANVTSTEDPTGDSDDSTVDVVNPGIDVTKTLEGPITVTGDDTSKELVFTITVRNTGDVALSDVTVTDPTVTDAGGTINCGDDTNVIATLAADDGLEGGADEASCTATVTITPDDDGIWSAVNNTATACGESPIGDVDDPDDDVCDDGSETVDFTGIKVDKQVGPTADGPWSDSYDAAVGDTVYWQVTVTNIGTVDLMDVAVADEHNDDCAATVGTLPAGETYSITCSEVATYSDTGVTNTAVVEGCAEVDETGACTTPVEDEDDATYSALYNGFTPGFWKNHAKGKNNMWDGDLVCGTGLVITTRVTLADVFGDFTLSIWQGKGNRAGYVDVHSSDITLLEALSLQGGSTIDGATEILLRAASATFLNACFHETQGHATGEATDSWPVTSQDVIDQVTAAIESGDRDAILALAAEYDGWNNGLHDIDWTDWR